MSDGLIWLTIFAGLLVATAVVGALLGEGWKALGCLAVPVTASVLFTAYVIKFDPDPQAPIVLFMFYVVAAVAGAIGAVIGLAVRHGLRTFR